MNLEAVAACLPMNVTLDYSDAVERVRVRTKTPPNDASLARAIVGSLHYAGLVRRGPGGNGDVNRVDPAVITTATPKRGPVMVGITDEFGGTREYPVGPKADAEIERIKTVRRRAEKARLMMIMGTDIPD
jgi:hypothetical protein